MNKTIPTVLLQQKKYRYIVRNEWHMTLHSINTVQSKRKTASECFSIWDSISSIFYVSDFNPEVEMEKKTFQAFVRRKKFN
jgi:hypothetical protein